MTTATDLIVLATEGGIPTSNPWSQLAVPLGIVIFVGSVYLLLRSNLGTRRGYLVMSTSLWAFAFLISLFWAFGAPGTPPTTGPQNLPGQSPDAYLPTWYPFAPDSNLVTEEGSPYRAAADYPDGWGEVPEDFADTASTGVQNITSFFSDLKEQGYTDVLFGDEAVVGEPRYTEAENGRPIIAVTVASTCQLIDDPAAEEGTEEPEQVLPPNCEAAGLEVGDPVPAETTGEAGDAARNEQTFFAFFDAGSPYFPSMVMTGIFLVLLVLHMLLLARDETRERRELDAAAADRGAEVEERAPVSA